jgi:hypothetical protein
MHTPRAIIDDIVSAHRGEVEGAGDKSYVNVDDGSVAAAIWMATNMSALFALR